MSEPLPPTIRSDANRNTKRAFKDSTLEDMHSYRVNRNSFTVFVGGDPHDEGDFDGNHGIEPGVTHHMADRFEMNLNFLSSIDPERPILVSMSTCGGNWEEGMQMFSSILMCPNPVTVLGTKWCRSMSSIIPLAADRFVLRPPAMYMIHRGTCGIEGIEAEFDTADMQRRKANEMMYRIYVTRLRERGAYRRHSEQRLRESLNRRFEKEVDVWFTPDEAVHWGFADAVFDGDLKKLRATKKDLNHRARMLEVLRRPIKVEITVS